MKKYSFLKSIYIPIFAVVFFVLSVTPGCSGGPYTREEMERTGGLELVYHVDVDYALNGLTKDIKDTFFQYLKIDSIPFSRETKTKLGEIEFLGISSQYKNQVFNILKQWSPEWDYRFDGEVLRLKIKPKARDLTKKLVVLQVKETIRTRLQALGLDFFIENIPDGSVELKIGLAPHDLGERVRVVIQTPGQLEFKKVKEGPFPSKEEALQKFGGKLPEDLKGLWGVSQRMEKKYYIVKDVTVLTGRFIDEAEVSADAYGAPCVKFTLSPQGGKRFQSYSAANIGKKLAIILDDKVLTAPIVNSVISREGQITGRFSRAEAENLALILNTGALPAPVRPMSVNVIKPKE